MTTETQRTTLMQALAIAVKSENANAIASIAEELRLLRAEEQAQQPVTAPSPPTP